MSEPQRASVQKGATNAHRLRGLFRYLLIDRTPIWKGASLQERPFENEGKKSKQKHAKQKKIAPRGDKKAKWLGHQDSNLDSWNQNPESCRWTMAHCPAACPQVGPSKRRPLPCGANRLSDAGKVVGREGIEPATLGLKVPCSAS